MGAGRSGTTLLDILLGNHPACESIGEINRYFNRFGEPHKTKNENELLFWKKVKDEVIECFGEHELLNQRKNFKKFEYYSGVFTPKFLHQKDYNSYLNFTSQILKTLGRYHNNKILIDSSKYPLRQRILKDLGYDVRTIFLIRRPSSVIRSFMKKKLEQPPKGFFEAFFYYLITNLFCHFQNIRNSKCVLVTYEDLILKPKETLDLISRVSDMDMNVLKAKIEKDEDLKVGYLFDGNRIRLSESIKLKSQIDTKPSVGDKVIDFLLKPVYSK